MQQKGLKVKTYLFSEVYVDLSFPPAGGEELVTDGDEGGMDWTDFLGIGLSLVIFFGLLCVMLWCLKRGN